MIEKIKKLMILINNCDKIMEMLDSSENNSKNKSSKVYSLFNTPREQRDYINKKMKGEK